MAPKRKRGIAQSTTSKSPRRKRTRVPQSSPHPHGSFDPEQEYKIRSIVEETATSYLIDWEGVDPRTDLPWERSWEPKQNANERAIAAWESEKAAKKQHSSTGSGRSVQSSATSSVSKKQARQTTPTYHFVDRRPRITYRVLDSQSSPIVDRHIEEDVIELQDQSSPFVQPHVEEDIVESHSQSSPVALNNVEEEIDESLEIDESPQTSPRHCSQEELSIFLPENDTICPSILQQQYVVTVEPSEPPSSYLTFDSSQIISGTAPERPRSPEPSQFQPEVQDTSRTTESTTDISIIPTNSSLDHIISAVDTPGETLPNNLVLDSQDLHASSSFVQTDDHTTGECSAEQYWNRALSEITSSEAEDLLTSLVEQIDSLESSAEQIDSTASGESELSACETAVVIPSAEDPDVVVKSRTSIEEIDTTNSSDSQAFAQEIAAGASAVEHIDPTDHGGKGAVAEETATRAVSAAEKFVIPAGGQSIIERIDTSDDFGETRASIRESEVATTAAEETVVLTDSHSAVEQVDVVALSLEDTAATLSAVEELVVPLRSGTVAEQTETSNFNESRGPAIEILPAGSPVTGGLVPLTLTAASQAPSDTGAKSQPSSLSTSASGIATPPPEDQETTGRVHSTSQEPSQHPFGSLEPKDSSGQPVGSNLITTAIPAAAAEGLLDTEVSQLDRHTDSSTQSAPDTGSQSQTTASNPDPTSAQVGLTADSPSSSEAFLTQLPPPATSTQAAQDVSVDQEAAQQSSPEQQPRASPNSVLSQRDSSALHSSSLLPSIPSHNIEIVGGSAPARLSTPSSPVRSRETRTPHTPPRRAMDAAETPTKPGSSLKEQLAAMRARVRAEHNGQTQSPATSQAAPPSAIPPRVTAELALSIPAHTSSIQVQEGPRSPSAIPAQEPVPAASQEEMNTSERFGTLMPEGEAFDTSLFKRAASPIADMLDTDQANGDASRNTRARIVPIPLMGHQRDEYKIQIRRHSELIQRFLNDTTSDLALAAEAEILVQRLRSIAINPDLDDLETLTQYDSDPTVIARWYADCSTKFCFLQQLIEDLVWEDLRIALLTRPGRLQDMLHTYIKGLNLEPLTGAGLRDSDTTLLKIGLVSEVDSVWPTGNADLVISVDDSVQEYSRLVGDEQDVAGAKKPLLINLVVPYSIEHVELSLPVHLTPKQRLKTLISACYQLRHEGGKQEHRHLAPRTSAQRIAAILKSGDHSQEDWRLPGLSILENLDAPTDSDNDEHSISEQVLQQPLVPPSNAHAGHKHKRGLSIDDMIEDPSKRSRVASPTTEAIPELPATINPMQIEISHISDSISHPTKTALDEIEPQQTDASDLNPRERRLQMLLKEAQDRLQEHIQAMSRLQYDHEQQRTELIKVIEDRDQAHASASNATNRMTEFAGNLTTTRVEQRELRAQLAEAFARLADHSIPERAELERERLEVSRLRAEMEKLQTRLDSQRNDLDYAQSMYQDSSSNAKALASQTAELESQLAHASKRATDERARLRAMGRDNLAANLRRENAQLKARLRDLEAAMKFRDEEIVKLKEASRGRMGTRGTSVPRSPRLASPKVASRQNSPAAGELRGKAALLHPLRNG